MANEATLVLKNDEPVDFIVLDANGIEKGTVMLISAGSTIGRTARASAATDSGTAFAGIARREKIANDGRTRLALFRRGIFRMTAADGGTITAGQHVTISGANFIRTATEAEIAAGGSIGIALEDFAASGTEEVMVGGY